MRKPFATRRMQDPFYTVLGLLFVAISAVGAVLPILPTTPFLLLAAWAFARGNRRLARWLEDHPRFGPLLRDWREHRVIPLHAKVLALSMMALTLLHLIVLTDIPVVGVAIGGTGMIIGAGYILSCPHARPACRKQASHEFSG